MFAKAAQRLFAIGVANRKMTAAAVATVACTGSVLAERNDNLVVSYHAKGLPRWMKNNRTRFDYFSVDGKMSEIPFLKAVLCIAPTFKPEHNPEKLNSTVVKKLFDMTDANQDGIVVYEEFAMLMSMLSVSTRDLEILFQMYDFDGSGTIEKNEFKAVATTILDDPKLDVDKAIGTEWKNGFVNQLFGSKESITWPQVRTFVEGLKAEVDHVEFAQYDKNNSGRVTGAQFLHMLSRSITGHFLPPDVAGVLMRYSKDETDEKFPEHVWSTFTRLMNMSSELQRVIRVFTRGGIELTKADFKRAVEATGLSLSASDVDTVFALFDLNQDGTLEYDEFMSVMGAKRISRN